MKNNIKTILNTFKINITIYKQSKNNKYEKQCNKKNAFCEGTHFKGIHFTLNVFNDNIETFLNVRARS